MRIIDYSGDNDYFLTLCHYSMWSNKERLMPQHKSNIKRMKKSRMENQRNRAQRSQIKTAVKKVMDSKKKKDGQEALKDAFSVIDKSVKKGVIHRNKAANKKASLHLAVNKLK